eukprot:scpid80996/ scgid32763/ 
MLHTPPLPIKCLRPDPMAFYARVSNPALSRQDFQTGMSCGKEAASVTEPKSQDKSYCSAASRSAAAGRSRVDFSLRCTSAIFCEALSTTKSPPIWCGSSSSCIGGNVRPAAFCSA